MTATEQRIVHATVVTQDDDHRVFTDAELAYSPNTGLITYVGEIRGPGADFDAAGSIVMPGLVNAHTHSAMTPLRGYSDDTDFMTWLGAMRKFEDRMTYSDVRAGLQLALAEMIRTGTTCFADMFMWDTELLGDVVSAGLRVLAAPAVFNYDAVSYPTARSGTGRAALDSVEVLAAEFAGEDLVRLAFGPHAPYSCGPELLKDVASRAVKAGLPVHIHLSETRGEVDRCQVEHGCTPIELAQRCGLFETQVLVAHGTHATAKDAEILARAGAAVAHNPVSNLKLGAGIAPLADLRAAGVRMALGTDSVASNNSLDLFEEIKVGTMIHRGLHEVPNIVSSTDLLDMATWEGAAAVGFGNSGRLVAGSAADFIVVATDSTRAAPMSAAASFLAYAATGADVRGVVVAGRELLRDRQFLTVDEAAAREQVDATSDRIIAELGA